MQKNTFNQAHSGAHYLSKGFSLIWKPGIKKFVFIPLFINFVLLTIATIYAFNGINEWYTSLQQSEYAIVQWVVTNLDWLLWPLIVISVMIIVFFTFSFLANWIAAPFNGLLAEAVEKHLAGDDFEGAPFKWGPFLADIPRLLGRELKKFSYYVPRALACLLLFFIFPPIVPIVWFLFNAWMAAIQYIDYPMDNHKVPFATMLEQIKESRSGPFGFGALVMLLTMIPVVNIMVMPVAVSGATCLWFDHYR